MKSNYMEISSGLSEEAKLNPIIFLHEMMESGASFMDIAPSISRQTKRKVYLPDARNHGQSPWADAMDYDVLVDDLLEFMQEHEICKAILVGHSMGGRTALYFALKFPHKVEALVVEDMTPRNIKTAGGFTFMQVLLSMFNGLLERVTSHMKLMEVKRIVSNKMMDILGPTYAKKRKNGNCASVHVVKDGNCYRMECNAAAVENMLTDNALVQNLPDRNLLYYGNALFLYGSFPFFNIENDKEIIKKLFPNAVVKHVEGAGHWIHRDSTKQYIRIVSDFISDGGLPLSKY